MVRYNRAPCIGCNTCLSTSLHCRTQAERETDTYKFDQVINEDASLEFAYAYTARDMVRKVMTEGGSGCFISLGLLRSGKTFLVEVSMRLAFSNLSGRLRKHAHQSTATCLHAQQLRSAAPQPGSSAAC